MMDLFVVQVQQECLYLNTHSVINPATIHYNNYSETHLLSSFSPIKGMYTILKCIYFLLFHIKSMYNTFCENLVIKQKLNFQM